MSTGTGTDIVWEVEAKTDSSSIVRLGIWSIGVVMTLFMIWGLFFPLASAVITPGTFISEGNNKLIQHGKGGKIRAIFVSEGDVLTANQPVIELDRTEMQAELTRLEARHDALSALKVRLDAERFGSQEKFPFQSLKKQAVVLRGRIGSASLISSLPLRGANGAPLVLQAALPENVVLKNQSLQHGNPRNHAGLVDGQREAYRSGRNLLSTEVAALNKKVEGLVNQKYSLLEKVKSQSALLESSEREYNKMKPLAELGYVARNRLSERERSVLELRGQVAAGKLQTASIGLQIEEMQVQIQRAKAATSNAASKEYTRIIAELAEISDQLAAARSNYRNAVIRAPVAGRLTNLSVGTVGGVLGGGDVAGQIVPEAATLVVQARVQPSDIDYVRLGQTADIIVTAFNRRVDDSLSGNVQYISADSETDEKTGETYFTVRLGLEAVPQDLNSRKSDIVPGMQAEVYIQTGSRTFMTYLFKPISDSFRKSFREQ